MTARTRRVFLVGLVYGIYVLVAVAFASYYEQLYQEDPNHFSFAAQITTTQKAEQENLLESSRATLSNKRRSLDAREHALRLLKALDRLRLAREPKQKWLVGRLVADAVIFEFQFDPEWQAAPMAGCAAVRGPPNIHPRESESTRL